ncbi:MAG: hypothetical protein JWP78_73 [Mucilaginibacter sp.]|nr:hypothetical protein [Mucilaginibacter sp.]
MSKEKLKMKMVKVNIRFILTIALLIPHHLLFAQATDPGPLPCNDGDPFNTNCPIDSWVWLLVLAALAAVIYQLSHKTKSAQS